MKRLILVNKLIMIGFICLGCVGSQTDFDSSASFEEIPTNQNHIWDKSVHPFTGAAAIDIDNDGKMEVFISGGKNQSDALLTYRDSRHHS